MVRNIVNVLYQQPFSKSIMDAPLTKLPDSTKPAYTGIYRYGATDKESVSVVLIENELYLKIQGSDDIKLDAINPNVFRSGTARIEFSGPGKGRFSQVMVFKNGEFLGAQKSQ